MSCSIYEKTIRQLSKAGIVSPRLEARILIADVLHVCPDYITDIVSLMPKELQKLEGFIQRRCKGEPLDKVLGKKEFYKNTFIVSKWVLSPRPETEVLVEEAIQLIKEQKIKTVADLGTGSGCILLSLLKECQNVKGVGVDKSKRALNVARKNAVLLEVTDRCRFVHKSWFDLNFEIGSFDMIVSNPPYIQTNDIDMLDVSVKEYDPVLALDGGEDGFQSYLRIAELSQKMLNDNGYLLLEAGFGQADHICYIFEDAGLKHIKTIKDLAGISRCLVFQK